MHKLDAADFHAIHAKIVGLECQDQTSTGIRLECGVAKSNIEAWRHATYQDALLALWNVTQLQAD